MKLDRWTAPLNQQVVPFAARPDAARWPAGPAYRIIEVFHTRDGSWEKGGTARGSVEDWAADEWWQGAKIDGSGGATHLFAIALDAAGKPMPGKGLWFWTGEMTSDFDPPTKRQAKADGSENVSLNGHGYVPERGEHGDFSCCAFGRSDVLRYVSLPANEHVSTFVVFQEVPGGTTPDPEPEQDAIGDDRVFVRELILTRMAAKYTPANAVRDSFTALDAEVAEWAKRTA